MLLLMLMILRNFQEEAEKIQAGSANITDLSPAGVPGNYFQVYGLVRSCLDAKGDRRFPQT